MNNIVNQMLPSLYAYRAALLSKIVFVMTFKTETFQFHLATILLCNFCFCFKRKLKSGITYLFIELKDLSL